MPESHEIEGEEATFTVSGQERGLILMGLRSTRTKYEKRLRSLPKKFGDGVDPKVMADTEEKLNIVNELITLVRRGHR